MIWSWAARRRFLYISGVFLFFLVTIGGPVAYKLATIALTCHDGKLNHGETAIDRGGPCLLLDERYLQPHSVLWARSFLVRDGSYNAVAYIENPNPSAGVPSASYTFDLYDSQNVLVAERSGTTYIMPGGVTPVLLAGIDTGHRLVAHTYFTLTDPTLVWEKMNNPVVPLSISSKQVITADTVPQLTAIVNNSAVYDVRDASFVGVVFDTVGNAINASATSIPRLLAGAHVQITFTWPFPFPARVGTEDIIPILPPIPDPAAER